MPKNQVAPSMNLSISRFITSSTQIKALISNDRHLILKDIENLDIASALLRVQAIAKENSDNILDNTNKWTNKTFRLLYDEFRKSKADYYKEFYPEEKAFIEEIINKITELNNFKFLEIINILKNNSDKKNKTISKDEDIIRNYEKQFKEHDIAEVVYHVYNSNDSIQSAITQIKIIIDKVFPIEIRHVEPLRLLQPQPINPPRNAPSASSQQLSIPKQGTPCFITQISVSSLENRVLKIIAENMIKNFDAISRSSKSRLCAIL